MIIYSEIRKEGEGRWKMEGEEYMNKKRQEVSILILILILITRHSKRVTTESRRRVLTRQLVGKYIQLLLQLFIVDFKPIHSIYGAP